MSYNNPKAFERLMLLIATIVKNPGIGYKDGESLETEPNGEHHDALGEVRKEMKNLARTLHLDWKENYPSIPTLRKDIEKLRDYGLLDRRMYRWGYYLGSGALNGEELKIAFDALQSQAHHQKDPKIRRIYDRLQKRLRGFESDSYPAFFYPVRQNLDRTIEYTDPEIMMERGVFRPTLYEKIDLIEKSILAGEAIEICRRDDPYQNTNIGMTIVYPLQLIYHDIAWYLLFENPADGCLAIGRLNRYTGYYRIVEGKERSLEKQLHSLNKAKKLLKNGWGLNLGDRESQQLELEGKLKPTSIIVRFYSPVSYFIKEGELRHAKQILKNERFNRNTKKIDSIDYHIDLPPRSLNEFLFWVQRYSDKAKILAPSDLAEKHHRAALALVERYTIGE